MNSAVLVAYGALLGKSNGISLLIACYGMVASFFWILVCLGSKWWQVAWERKVEKYQQDLEPGLFTEFDLHSCAMCDAKPEKLFVYPLMKFSVTGAATAIATFSLLLWLALVLWHFRASNNSGNFASVFANHKSFWIIIGSFIFCFVSIFLTFTFSKKSSKSRP